MSTQDALNSLQNLSNAIASQAMINGTVTIEAAKVLTEEFNRLAKENEDLKGKLEKLEKKK